MQAREKNSYLVKRDRFHWLVPEALVHNSRVRQTELGSGNLLLSMESYTETTVNALHLRIKSPLASQ